MTATVLDAIQAELGPRAIECGFCHGMLVLQISPAELTPVVSALKDQFQFDMFLDVTAVDWPEQSPRFEVVYHFYSTKHFVRVCVKARVPESDPVVPSLYTVWKAADWFEREAFDLMGIRFAGHPNLKRILCHPSFQGHALRKDYDPGQRWLLREGEQDVPAWAAERSEDEDHFETQVINLGPSHPATHGTLRTTVRLDGEVITQAEAEIGYLHRCFEKMSESHTIQQICKRVVLQHFRFERAMETFIFALGLGMTWVAMDDFDPQADQPNGKLSQFQRWIAASPRPAIIT